MNLKEAFRYQNFLSSMLNNARSNLCQRDHALKTIETHRKSAADPDACDVVEVANNKVFEPNDNVIKFILWLIDEREKLSLAISWAKKDALVDIDAEIIANKFRQNASDAIRIMLSFEPTTRKDVGRGYKFNNEGVQAPYVYDIEITQEELFDRDASKSIMMELLEQADRKSAEIDSAMVNTEVLYTPVFNVNSTFADVMAEFNKMNQ